MSEAEYEYTAFVAQEPVEVAGVLLYPRVHWAVREGRAVVVGVDLRTFWSETESSATQAILRTDMTVPPAGEVSTATLRALRFGELVEASRQALAQSLLDAPPPPADDAPGRAALEGAVDGGARRRGPRPNVPDATLAEVVVPAYVGHVRTGGRKPVKAAQEAMQESGAFGAAVSIDMARKAVERARRLGLIAPAEQKGKP